MGQMRVRFLNPICLDGGHEQKCVLQLQEEWVESGLVEVEKKGDENFFNRLDESSITDENPIAREKTLVLLSDKSDVAGYLVFRPLSDSDKDYEIDSLFVSESYRGLDGGPLLMEHAEKYIKCKGGKSIELCPVSKKNKCKLIKFYKELEYVDCGFNGKKRIMQKKL